MWAGQLWCFWFKLQNCCAYTKTHCSQRPKVPFSCVAEWYRYECRSSVCLDFRTTADELCWQVRFHSNWDGELSTEGSFDLAGLALSSQFKASDYRWDETGSDNALNAWAKIILIDCWREWIFKANRERWLQKESRRWLALGVPHHSCRQAACHVSMFCGRHKSLGVTDFNGHDSWSQKGQLPPQSSTQFWFDHAPVLTFCP